MTQLPNSAQAQVQQAKIVGYLLNLTHADGGPKAAFFIARGFVAERWDEMADALVTQGRNNPVTKIVAHPWGVRYQVDCHCPTPDGANPCIRTVWELADVLAAPRLLTAYPLKN
ncbi:MAG: hypothetical protein IPH08_06225 [Rhodocyclaceae bacterium]|jgi:hypothetical protein|nr:hypothetical protein [Rhodocyclaceae bacterium]MBK6906677.1 hypothetical protein [Rhodocyclaceae bacterium]